ncbi:hypothetical protein BKA70DRAFT_1237202 [Coprinopsis sp. MPI-PUGE-AT-0042]|nr:hypothetical protein BKA70DRAFT_1237202 [Coprinopsis sp. MPI-PUGE-AT-0042]
MSTENIIAGGATSAEAMPSDINTRPQKRSDQVQPHTPEDARKLEDLREKVATLSQKLFQREMDINSEKKKVAALNLEILQTRLAADRDLQVTINEKVQQLVTQLQETERELEFYKEGTDELSSNLKDSRKSNAALITFLHQILVEGVYIESSWSRLKLM